MGLSRRLWCRVWKPDLRTMIILDLVVLFDSPGRYPWTLRGDAPKGGTCLVCNLGEGEILDDNMYVHNLSPKKQSPGSSRPGGCVFLCSATHKQVAVHPSWLFHRRGEDHRTPEVGIGIQHRAADERSHLTAGDGQSRSVHPDPTRYATDTHGDAIRSRLFNP